MGCDINAVLQKYDSKSQSWKTVMTDVIPNRDYQLFSILSGVRGDSELGPIATHLGHPEPIGELVELGAEHSFGILTMKDLKSYVKEIPTIVENPKTYKEAANNFLAQIERLKHEELEIYEDSDQKRINDLYSAFEILLGYDIDDYRLVFGYNS